MKSRSLCVALSLVTMMGFVGCSGSGGSGGDSSKSRENNVSFNGLNELKIKLVDDVEARLETQLLAKVNLSDITDEIKSVESAMATIESQLVEKRQLQIDQNSRVKEIEAELAEVDKLEAQIKESEGALKDQPGISGGLVEELKFSQGERDVIKEKYREQAKKLISLREKLTEKLKEKADLGFFGTAAEAYTGSIEEQIEILEKEVQAEEDVLTTIKKDFSKKEEKVTELTAKIKRETDAIKNDNRDAARLLKQRANDLSDKLNSLNEEMALLGPSLETLNTEISELEKNKISEEEKIASLKEQKEKLADINLLKEGDSLAAMKLRIIKSLREGNASIKEIAKALVALHWESLGINESTNTEIISEVTSLAELVSPNGIEELKTSYEDALSNEKHDGESLIYNKDAVRITDILFDNKMQCYSGTLFFNLINELSTNSYKDTVVIFTSGHVLPGYIEQVDGKKILKGIETTAAGKAIVNYGETKNISGSIRVFDAKQFLVAELLKNEIASLSDVYGQMLKTVERYGFKTDQFYTENTDIRKTQDSDPLNATIFAFGTANVPSGDQERAEFDTKENTDFVLLPVEESEGEHPYNRNEKPYPEEELLDCKSLKAVLGSTQVLDVDTSCIDDRGRLVNISSYHAKPIGNSGSVSYTSNGQRVEGILIDSYSNYTACTVHKNRDGNTFKIDLELDGMNLENVYGGIQMVLMNSGKIIREDKNTMKMPIPTISLETKNKSFADQMLKIHESSSDSASARISGEEVEASVGIMRDTLSSSDKGCSITANRTVLTALPPGTTSLGHGFAQPQGVQIGISCPELESNYDSIQDVEITVNCTVASQTYNY